MSFETWCEEFYPIEAKEVSKEDALAHSLRKWEGLRPKALKRHGMLFGHRRLYEVGGPECLSIDADSCALCVHHRGNHCEECPLEVAGQGCEHNSSPWKRFAVKGKIKPMISLLEKLVNAEEQAKKPTVEPANTLPLSEMGKDCENQLGEAIRVLELVEVSLDGTHWCLRYFSSKPEEGKISTFDDGATSETEEGDSSGPYRRRPR